MKQAARIIRTLALLASVSFLSAFAWAYSFQNRWEDVTQPLTVNGDSQFVLEEAGDGLSRIKEATTQNYLNIEKASLQSTPIQPGWFSTQWKIVKLRSTRGRAHCGFI